MNNGKWTKETETYWNKTNPCLVAEPVHFALLFSIEQIVVILHADKFRPAILLSNELQLRKLDCPHTARANIPYLPALNKIVKCLHGLLEWGSRVESMNLQKVDVVEVETLQRRIDGVEDGLSRQPALVRVVLELRHFFWIENSANRWILSDVAVAFGEDDQLFTWEVVFFDCLSDDFF